MKKVLVDRLARAVEKNVPLLANVIINEDEELASPDDGFAAQARWKILSPNEDDVIDEAALQTIDGVRFQNPTVRDNIVPGVEGATKKNYSVTFDRPPFIQSTLQPSKLNGEFVYDRHGRHEYSKQPTTKTLPNIEYLHDRGISLLSHPADWFDIFFPKKNGGNVLHL